MPKNYEMPELWEYLIKSSESGKRYLEWALFWVCPWFKKKLIPFIYKLFWIWKIIYFCCCSCNSNYSPYFFFQCIQKNGTWKIYDTNFDNIFSSMITLFILSTLEGWPDIMNKFIDAREYEMVRFYTAIRKIRDFQ